jgi:hypothetical protein
MYPAFYNFTLSIQMISWFDRSIDRSLVAGCVFQKAVLKTAEVTDKVVYTCAN